MEAHEDGPQPGRGRGQGSGWTTDHRLIRRWVEERGGFPARVRGTGEEDGAGLLRIDYPGFRGEDQLERIAWEDFFDKFEEANLAFVYQEETATGAGSRFSKLVDRGSFTGRARSKVRGREEIGEA